MRRSGHRSHRGADPLGPCAASRSWATKLSPLLAYTPLGYHPESGLNVVEEEVEIKVRAQERDLPEADAVAAPKVFLGPAGDQQAEVRRGVCGARWWCRAPSPQGRSYPSCSCQSGERPRREHDRHEQLAGPISAVTIAAHRCRTCASGAPHRLCCVCRCARGLIAVLRSRALYFGHGLSTGEHLRIELLQAEGV